jgi:hypothetical protein
MTTLATNKSDTSVSFAQLDLALIDPARGAKYSPNLYAFLRKRRSSGVLRRSSVYRDVKGTLWMGFIDDLGSFNGVKLERTLLDGAKTDILCYADLGPLTRIDNFWAQYVADGRCVFDRAHKVHFVGNDTRYSVQGGVRSCRWCETALSAQEAS